MAEKTDKKNPRRKPKYTPAAILQRLGLTRPGGRNVIGLQITPSILRIIEIDRGSNPPRIINFSAIDPLMDNVQEATDQILGLMHEKNIAAAAVQSMVYDTGVEHRQVSLPALNRNEMEALVRREVKKIVPEAGSRDIAFDFWLDRGARRAGRKSDVLIGVVPRENVGRIIGLMENCELETQLISTVPLSLISAFGAYGEKSTKIIAAMVHLERDRSFLVISNRGTWVFSREFQSVLTKHESENQGQTSLQARRQFASARYLADQERLLIEVNRSLLYFKQRFRGEGVGLIVMSGEAFNLDEIATAIGKNIGIESCTYLPSMGFQYSHLGDRAEKLERIFPSLALPIGAALQGQKETKLNFVPPAYQSRRQARLRRTLGVAAAVVVFVGLTVGYLMIRDTRTELEDAIRQSDQEHQLAELTRSLDRIGDIKQSRDLAAVRRAFLARFKANASPDIILLYALSNYLPDKACLLNVKVDDTSGKPLASIAGQVKSASIAETDAQLNLLYQRLQGCGLFASLKEPKINGTYENDIYVLAFQIEGELLQGVGP